MKKILDYTMWLAVLVSLAISLPTIIVAFGIYESMGIKYQQIKMFSNFLPLEVSLAVTFFLWGINGFVNKYTENSKKLSWFILLQAFILCFFMYKGIYL